MCAVLGSGSKGEITTWFCNGYELIQVKASFTFLFSSEALRVPFCPVPFFFFWLPIYLSSDSCPRRGMCRCVGIPAALLSPLDGCLVFPHLSCLPGRSCRVSLGSRVPKAWVHAFLAGWGALGVLPEAAVCRGRLSKPLSPFSGPVCQVSSFQGLLAFWFCSKPICETHFQNLSDFRRLPDNTGSSSICFLVLTCFTPSPFPSHQRRCLPSLAAVSFF